MAADRGSWMQSGHCVKINPKALRVPRDSVVSVTTELCRSCPVRPTCLGWALVNGIDDGILGGIDPARRRRLRRDLLKRLQGRPIAGSAELAELVRTQAGPAAPRPATGAPPTSSRRAVEQRNVSGCHRPNQGG